MQRLAFFVSVAAILAVALSASAVLAASSGPAAGQAVVPAPEAADWVATGISLRGKTGSRFVYICPAGGRLDQVWGTDTYADNSSVCTAAVHRGVITVADGGTVTIEHLAGLSSYTGSTGNGVTSANLGAWPGSFGVIGADKGGGAPGVKMGGAGWTASATTYRGLTGSRYSYVCPGGGRLQGVYGTNTYTDDSSVCTAAVHVGLVTPANGGTVTIEMRPGQSAYTSFTSNGVKSSVHGTWPASFRFPAAAIIPGSTGGGGGGGTTTTTTNPGTTQATGTATGTVTVNGRPFTSGRVPYNSTVDVTNGNLLLKTDTGSLHLFGSGVTSKFKLLRGTDKRKPIVELRLTGGDFGVCKRKTSSASSTAATTTVRQLWGDGKGQFRTNGRYSAASVRGTNWLTADRCDGTFTRVKRGVVQVNDRKLKKQITLRAGKSYLAKP